MVLLLLVGLLVQNLVYLLLVEPLFVLYLLVQTIDLCLQLFKSDLLHLDFATQSLICSYELSIVLEKHLLLLF